MRCERKSVLDLERFREAGIRDRDVTLFFMNDVLEEERLRESVRSFREAGWASLITRSFNGLATDYMSDAYMDALSVINDEAEKQGLSVWFQAGQMPGGMPDLPIQHANRCLCKVEPGEELPEDAELLATGEDGTRYILKSLFDKLALLEPSAIQYYVRSAYEEAWFKRFGDAFGNRISGVWVDEPMLHPGTLPWCSMMESRFKEKWGYNLRDHIIDLFVDSDVSAKVRHHYYRTSSELLLEAYFTEVRNWCDKHGVDFTGHLMGEDTIARQIAYTVDCMPQYQYLSVPGIDHLTSDMKWGTETNKAGEPYWFILTPKQASSAAHQIGKERILSEMYGVSSQDLTFFERKYIGEFLAVMGITMRCIHGSAYSLRGKRKRIYPPTISHHQPWFKENRMVTDHFARLQSVLRQGTYVADALVLHPVESGYCIYDGSYSGRRGEKLHSEALLELDGSLSALLENMHKAHLGFDLGNEMMMAEMARVDDGTLKIGEMSYPSVVLPDLLTMRETTVDLLESFMDAGGRVFTTGSLPEMMDGEPSERVKQLCESFVKCENDSAALKDMIGQSVPRRYEIDAVEGDIESVWVHERKAGNETILFMLNIDKDTPVSFELTLKTDLVLEELDRSDGSVKPLGGVGPETACAMTLPGGGSMLLRAWPETASAADSSAASGQEKTVATCGGDWTISREAPNVQTLDFCKLRCGNGEWSDLLPVRAIPQILLEDAPYEGPIELEYGFEVEQIPASLSLAMELPDEFEWIELNGEKLDPKVEGYYIDRSFECIGIQPRVKVGKNVIRMARDYQQPETPKFGLQARFQNLGEVEIEDIYLVGDFALTARPTAGTGRQGGVAYVPEFKLVEEPSQTSGDLLQSGYPFYAGSMALEQTIEIREVEDGKRYKLVLDNPDTCVARVFINDCDMGALGWAPWEVDVTEGLVEGENRVRLELTNTLRNLLGPLHRTSGKPGNCWGEIAFSGRWDWETDYGNTYWYKDRSKDTPAWSDNYYFMPFGPGRVRVVSD